MKARPKPRSKRAVSLYLSNERLEQAQAMAELRGKGLSAFLDDLINEESHREWRLCVRSSIPKKA